MRIAIDARMMGAENTRGIGRYIEELLHAMILVRPEHQYVVIARRHDHAFASHPSVKTIVADIPWYGCAEQFKMPAILRSARADVIHIPHWNVPLTIRGPLIVTIHDLLLRHEPMSAKISTRNPVTRAVKRLGYRMTLAHAINAARRILVPTHCVAEDVTQFYPGSAKKIVVTGEGMEKGVKSRPACGTGSRQMLEKSKVHSQSIDRLPSTPFFLYVGSAYPHKGLFDLLAAWEKIAVAHPDFSLFIVGEMDVFMRRVKQEAESKKCSRVAFVGRVSENELEDLYSRATAFVFPSHAEGFGLPPLEAISAGCPVVCADIPVLREVLGNDGVLFFRAGDPDDILRAVTELLHTLPDLRNQIQELAARLRKRWSWKRAAEQTLAAYREISF
ncbi:MAG: glycosyltransferase family 1 protein [Patescibacteria group bacterium]